MATRYNWLPYFITYLTDILVPHLADLLDICGALGDSLEGVSEEDQLILLGLGDLDIDTAGHHDSPDDLLADEVAGDNVSNSVFVITQYHADSLC